MSSLVNRDIPGVDPPSACPAADSSASGSASTRSGNQSSVETAASAVGQQGSDRPEVIFRASVSAQEVRFASKPEIRVRLCGGVGDTVRVIERRNLPKPVVAGRTYRDVFVSVEILAHLVCASQGLVPGGTAPARPDSSRGSSQQCTSLSIGAGAGATPATPATRPPPEDPR